MDNFLFISVGILSLIHHTQHELFDVVTLINFFNFPKNTEIHTDTLALGISTGMDRNLIYNLEF